MSIIGITGRKRHGKDTIADYLVEHYGYTKMAFADPIRDICRDMFGFTDGQFGGHDKEAVDDRWGISPRQAMQFIGTDLVRAHIHELLPTVGEDFWVKCLMNRVPPGARIVVSDVRFPNEAAAIRSQGTLWRVKRSVADTKDDTHISESMVDGLDVDAELDNNDDLANLYRQIDTLCTLGKVP